MCDEFIHPGLIDDSRITRRTFGVLAAAAAAAGTAQGAMPKEAVSERDVSIKTADGTADAVLFTPKKGGRFPAVLMWPDIMGLRPAFRDMGSRLASSGYAVLVPNPFYRSKRSPVMEGPIEFSDPATRTVLMGYRKAMSDQGVTTDAQAYLTFLDAQPATNARRKAAVQGYCMGGTLALLAAAAVPGRIGAVASFHGGNGLVTKEPNSPHLLIPKTNAGAQFLFLQAQNDDKQQPQVKDDLKAALAAAHRHATVEVYPANHGWCVPGSQVYDPVQAERAWTALLQLYRSALA
jgi:carboxymethylenebutenolidase